MSQSIDVAQLVQRIRAEVDQRSEKPTMSVMSLVPHDARPGVEPDLLSGLTSLHVELDALQGRIQSGEPLPPSATLSERAGTLVKRRLYRFLWWQSNNINAIAALTLRNSSEELRLAASVSGSIGRLHQETHQAQDMALESARKLQQCENRLQQLESAQLRLQASQIKQNVERSASQWEARLLESETKIAQSEARAVQSETKIAQWEARALQSETKIAQCEARALQSETKIAQCEARAVQAETQIAQWEARALQAETQIAQCEARASQSEANLDSLRREMAETRQMLDGAEGRIMQQLANSNPNPEQKIQELTQRLDLDTAERERFGARLSELGVFTHQTRTGLTMQDRRLSVFIEEARKRLPEPFNQEQLQNLVTNHQNHKLDWVYGAFEDVFRGSRDEIKARQAVYLPFLKQHQIGTSAMPILDLGCGRGEWLELLGEHSLEARGIDMNEAMVEQCHAFNLNVEKGEAISFLRGLPESSIGALTSFHMVEHLPFDVVLSLIDEALRVLKPNGILVLETPNPQNLMVGAHTFYLDPTHLNPLPSPMLRFFVEARGFCDAHVWELQPYPESMRLPENGNVIAKRLNDLLYGPQDYSVVGRKP